MKPLTITYTGAPVRVQPSKITPSLRLPRIWRSDKAEPEPADFAAAAEIERMFTAAVAAEALVIPDDIMISCLDGASVDGNLFAFTAYNAGQSSAGQIIGWFAAEDVTLGESADQSTLLCLRFLASLINQGLNVPGEPRVLNVADSDASELANGGIISASDETGHDVVLDGNYLTIERVERSLHGAVTITATALANTAPDAGRALDNDARGPVLLKFGPGIEPRAVAFFKRVQEQALRDYDAEAYFSIQAPDKQGAEEALKETVEAIDTFLQAWRPASKHAATHSRVTLCMESEGDRYSGNHLTTKETPMVDVLETPHGQSPDGPRDAPDIPKRMRCADEAGWPERIFNPVDGDWACAHCGWMQSSLQDGCYELCVSATWHDLASYRAYAMEALRGGHQAPPTPPHFEA